MSKLKRFESPELVSRKFELVEEPGLYDFLEEQQLFVKMAKEWALGEIKTGTTDLNKLSAKLTRSKKSIWVNGCEPVDVFIRTAVTDTIDTYKRLSKLKTVGSGEPSVLPQKKQSLKLNPYFNPISDDGSIRIPKFGVVKLKRFKPFLTNIVNLRLKINKGRWFLFETGNPVWMVKSMVRDNACNHADWGVDWGVGRYMTLSSGGRTLLIDNPLNSKECQDLAHQIYFLKNKIGGKTPGSNRYVKLSKLIYKKRKQRIKVASELVMAQLIYFLETQPVDALTFETLDFKSMLKSNNQNIKMYFMIRDLIEVNNLVKPQLNRLIRSKNIQKTYAPPTFPSSNICSHCLRATIIGRNPNFECGWDDCKMYGLKVNRDVNASRVLQQWGYHVRHETEPLKAKPMLVEYQGGLKKANPEFVMNLKKRRRNFQIARPAL